MTSERLRLCGAGLVLLLAAGGWAVAPRRLPRASASQAPPAHEWLAASTAATASAPAQTEASTGPTVIHVSEEVLHQNVRRLGVNLGAQSFYDSLQTLNNLFARNPGFEGQQWQSVMQCGKAGPDSCTGGPNSSAWPEGFLDGGTYEVISGAAEGVTGAIVHSSASNDRAGSRIQFSPMAKVPADGDYIAVRKSTPGDPTAGWDPQASGGATVAVEYKDLSPNTPGKQAVRIRASGPGQSLALKTYIDTLAVHSSVQLRGRYSIRFRARLVKGKATMGVLLQRLQTGASPMFNQQVALEDRWRDYIFSFTANEPRSALGPVTIAFLVDGAEVLVDDVSVAEATPNGTAFRGEVVAALQRLRPGVLRYMDSGQNFGSTLDNMLAPEDARQRTGSNIYLARADQVPLGLNDFLVLCAKLRAEPWYTIQVGWSEQEAANLMEFLGGPVTTKYGATRAALGHPEPWTQTFPMIHLEFANEAWNTAFPGASIPDPATYAGRVTTIFRAIRGSKWYAPGRIDLVADGQAVNPYLTQAILDRAEGVDTIDIAPYTFDTFDDDSSIENIFGPMFAEPEMLDSSASGYVRQQAEAVAKIAAKAKRPVQLAVYETNIGTVDGKVGQASLDATIPSVGAGIAAIEHMLLMLRDDGITVQNTFQLGGASFPFRNTAGLKDEISPVWAIVLDMGGATDRVRPSFLAEELANSAIRPTMLTTRVTGTDPTWDQPLSANDKVELKGAHELQSFAFSDGKTNALIVFNLSRTSRHSVGLDGQCVPRGRVTVETLTSDKITDSNEHGDKVRIVSREEGDVVPGKSTFDLPPFSMTVLSSSNPSNQGCMPVAKPSR